MRKLVISLLAFVLLVPASASAQTENAPPGNSGISQYLEVVPSSGGNTTGKRKSETASAPAAAPELATNVQAELAESGKSGRALKKFASETAPEKPKTTDKKASAIADLTAQSKSGALASTVTGGASTGMGIWLPIAMAVFAGIALFAAWRRRATGTES